MRVLVTGAGGFLGRHVVEAGIKAGHHVVALVRPTAMKVPWSGVFPDVVRGDLRNAPSLRTIGHVDAVCHLAAGVSGDLAADFSNSAVATERMFEAFDELTPRRFVHVSSFSVYDYRSIEQGDTLTAMTTKLETTAVGRGSYAETKLFQEQIVREYCLEHEIDLVVLRPGLIFGPGHSWGWGSDVSLLGAALVLAPRGRMPLTYVTNCADAIVKAIDASGAVGATLDVVDDESPTRLELRRHARQAGVALAPTIGIPWIGVRAVGAVASALDRLWFDGNARLPEILDPRRQSPRWKPLRYDNSAARQALGWKPEVDLHTAVRRVAAAT